MAPFGRPVQPQDPHIHGFQEFCASLGGPIRPRTLRAVVPQSHTAAGDLFAGLSSLRTLHLGDGAAELLVSALYGRATVSVAVISTSCTATTTITAITPASSGNVSTRAATWRGFLSESLQRVIVSRGAYSIRIPRDWIHYAHARLAEWDSSLLRMNVLADLSVPRWKPADIEPMEDVTGLLRRRSTGAQVSELSLAESRWDEPGRLEILRQLLHVLDPDRNMILQ
jgi:hypothetical protein